MEMDLDKLPSGYVSAVRRLALILKRDTIRIATYHKLSTPPEQTLVTINAWSTGGDGVVEGTEYGDNILGVQGHPEIDRLLPELFEFLVKD